jgi:hypothetical protein
MRNQYQAELTHAETQLQETRQAWEAAQQLPNDGAPTARQESVAKDKLRFAQSYRNDKSDLMNEADSLQLVPVLFDFPPTDVMIPMSWKLTKEQKRSIDDAWNNMVADEPHKSIVLLDQYFAQNGKPAKAEPTQTERLSALKTTAR